MTKVYNKLVRDKIPDIIKLSGNMCTVKILDDNEYLEMLDAKFDEELTEYHKDKTLEELADLLELIYAATIAMGHTIEELNELRVEKVEKRGAFNNKILLKEVIENEEI